MGLLFIKPALTSICDPEVGEVATRRIRHVETQQTRCDVVDFINDQAGLGIAIDERGDRGPFDFDSDAHPGIGSGDGSTACSYLFGNFSEARARNDRGAICIEWSDFSELHFAH